MTKFADIVKFRKGEYHLIAAVSCGLTMRVICMSVKKALENRRTVRKFLGKAISDELLVSYIDTARLSPSAANLQPLKYAVVTEKDAVSAVFENVKWAGYLEDYAPKQEEIPTAFIAIFKDKNIPSKYAEFDAGAAIMAMNLLAEEDGIGCCIMGAIHRENICQILKTPENLELLYVLAMGYKKENPKFVDLETEDIKYFLENGQLTVPKRKLSDILIKIS